MKIPVFFHIAMYIARLKKIAMSVFSNIVQPYSVASFKHLLATAFKTHERLIIDSTHRL